MRPTAVVPDRVHKNLYRLQWADGVLSADFYKLARANDILRNYDGYLNLAVMSRRMRNQNLKRLQTAQEARP